MKIGFGLVAVVGIMGLVIGVMGGLFLSLPITNWQTFLVTTAILSVAASLLLACLIKTVDEGQWIVDLTILSGLLIVSRAVVAWEGFLLLLAGVQSDLFWQWGFVLLADLALGMALWELWRSPNIFGIPLAIMGIVLVGLTVGMWFVLIVGFAARSPDAERVVSLVLAVGLFFWIGHSPEWGVSEIMSRHEIG